MDVLGALQAALEGRYEIVRELGRGGMAVVYLARDVKHDRQVAIKVLPPEMATSVVAERFLREIRTAAQLTHPNILPLHDSIAVDRVRCYVMPYVQGESLRERIERERQLGLDQAVDVARQVAAGLDYAHAHGIVHRDIKPENILLVGDQAMIADFGLARAVFTASSRPFTQTGMAVGTPAYMSPEQASGDQSVDGRADVYSLGCVFFEMVAGIPPFRGATAGAVLAAHATRKPPSLRAERDTCPAAIDAAVQRALAKVPADRFRTAGEFVHALESGRSGSTPMLALAAPAPRRAWLPWAAGAAAVALLAVAAPRVAEQVELARTPLDSNRVAVLPVQGDGGQRLTPPVAGRYLSSALMEWRDLKVVEPSADHRATIDAADGSRLARRAGASRSVLASLANMGDSVELRATLLDSHGETLRQRTLRLPDDARTTSAPYRQLVASLLRSDAAEEGGDVLPGTTNVAAWRAFTLGESARRAWRLPVAEAQYRRAITLDPTFARAQLWLAQVGAWQRPGQPREWGENAGRALAATGMLSPADSVLAAALTALASARYPDACALFRRLLAHAPDSDVPWYGLGFCQGLDPTVVPSRASPSGWAFRSSPYASAAAFDSALAHATGAPTFAFEALGRLLITEPSRKRLGHLIGDDAQLFYASPSLHGDTLAFIPYPASALERGTHEDQAAISAALQRDLERLRTTYDDWVRRAPTDAGAIAALAGIEESRGDPDALTLVRKARALEHTADGRLALAVSEIRLLLKAEQFDSARGAADSLLALNAQPSAEQAQSLAGVAALVGRVELAAQLLDLAAHRDPQSIFRSQYPAPAPMLDAGTELLARASAGECSGRLTTLAAQLDRMLVQYVPGAQRDELRRAMVNRPLSLAVPCLGPGVALSLAGTDPLLRMQQDLARRDQRTVRAAFASLQQIRRGLRPGDVSLDHTYQEATVLLMLGDSSAAARYLDLPLTALPTMSTHVLDDVASSFALGRALALRARLAAAAGDSVTARHAARNLAALWREASPSLQPVVRQSEAMSR